MCRWANIIHRLKATIRTSTHLHILTSAQGDHLHICTSAHLHIKLHIHHMKRLLSYIFLLITLIFASCSSDISEPKAHDITLKLQISSNIGKKVSLGWSYEQGDELIENWVVIMVNDADRKIEHIFTSEGKTLTNVEQDDVATTLQTTPANKTFYSFANLSLARLQATTGATFTEGAVMPDITSATLAIAGNGYDPTLGNQGIPMTGVTHMSLTNKDNETTKVLYVVRTLAKMQLDFTNNTGEAVTINSVSIDRVTDNPTGDAHNIMLFPYATPSDVSTQVTQRPMLNGDQPQGIFTVDINKVVDNGASLTHTFYVNESTTPANAFGQFMLTVDLTRADGTTTQQRYSVVSNENGEWTTISRNDWRIIPINLQDYKLDLIPQDFPAIGVLPSSVKEADGTFTCTFNGGGDFRLVPKVSRYSNGVLLPDTDWTFKNFTTETYPSAPPTDFYRDDTPPAWFARGKYVAGTFGSTTGEAFHTLYLTHTATGRTLVYRLRIVRN